MIIEYSSIYTEFPMELLNAPGLLDAQHDNACYYATDKKVELLEGPPRLLKLENHMRFAHRDVYLLKWPACRVYFSANEATQIR